MLPSLRADPGGRGAGREVSASRGGHEEEAGENRKRKAFPGLKQLSASQ